MPPKSRHPFGTAILPVPTGIVTQPGSEAWAKDGPGAAAGSRREGQGEAQSMTADHRWISPRLTHKLSGPAPPSE